MANTHRGGDLAQTQRLVRCGKKSQNLLIVHRRSVCHSRMHSTRFSARTAVFTGHRRRERRVSVRRPPCNFFRVTGFDRAGHRQTPSPLRRAGMCSNANTKKRRSFPRGRLFLFLRLSPDAIGHADRAQRRAEVNSAPTKAGTPQVTDGWFLLHGDCEIPSGTLGFEIATGKNITVCFA